MEHACAFYLFLVRFHFWNGKIEALPFFVCRIPYKVEQIFSSETTPPPIFCAAFIFCHFVSSLLRISDTRRKKKKNQLFFFFPLFFFSLLSVSYSQQTSTYFI